MVRIAGVNIDDNKQVLIALTGVYGIGLSQSKKLCNICNIDYKTKLKDISDNDIEKLRSNISVLSIEGDLRRSSSMNIKRLIDIGSYRGKRHKHKLPVRGQRTKTNAHTCKKMIHNKYR